MSGGLSIVLTHAFCWPEVRRGGERYLHELAASLSRRGHRVTVVAGARRPSVGRMDGYSILRLPRGEASNAMSAERRFGAVVTPVLAAMRADVVHSLGPRDAVAGLRSSAGHRRRRSVYTCLGLPLRASYDRRSDGEAHRRVVEEIDVYGCLSRYARELLRTDFGRDGALTPGGVDTERFRPSAARAPRPTLLFSGAIAEPRKGVATLLEAVAILADSIPDLELWLSGPGDPSRLLASAPSAARQRTTVLPLGAPADQPARYSAAWATVAPSHNEAFGLVLVESLACGTPVVAGDHAALPELVEPATGTVAPHDDPVALAEACGRVLELSRAADTRDACRAASMRHDWDRSVAPAIERLYLDDPGRSENEA